MTLQRIKKMILVASCGLGAWLIYDLISFGLNPQKLILLLYVVLVIATFSFLPEQVSVQATAAKEPTGTNPGKTSLEEKVLTIIRQLGKAQRHDLLPQVGLSRSSLGRLLDQMEAKGLIRQGGERKASYYVLAEKQG